MIYLQVSTIDISEQFSSKKFLVKVDARPS